uniref:Putative methyltransferase n=1 Tax=viral metagenome TaxID=1070528 RepID=A0A6M3KED7_9ZZZZ
MVDPRILTIGGWMAEPELEWLWHIASKLPPNSLVVEIGSWLGRSTGAIALGGAGKLRIVCIDTWKGQPDLVDSDHKLAKEIDLKAQFVTHMQYLGLNPTPYAGMPEYAGLYYLDADSGTAVSEFPDASIDWWFNDGDHLRLGADIDAYKPKFKADCLVTGHDYFCFYETIQQEIHKRFWINEIHHSIWVKYNTGKPPEWY